MRGRPADRWNLLQGVGQVGRVNWSIKGGLTGQDREERPPQVLRTPENVRPIRAWSRTDPVTPLDWQSEFLTIGQHQVASQAI